MPSGSEDPFIHLGVSENNGTPKSSILIGFSIINHPFWGTPIFGNAHLEYSTNACLKTNPPSLHVISFRPFHTFAEFFFWQVSGMIFSGTLGGSRHGKACLRLMSHRIHGTIVYLPTNLVDFYGFHVGKYTIHGWYGCW